MEKETLLPLLNRHVREALDLLSQERRCERYIIIFIWKISQGFVRLCYAFPAKFKERPVSRYSSLDKTMPSPVVNAQEALIKVKGAHLFNLIPCELLGMSGVTAETFKAHLDEWLSTILDEPTIPG